MLGRNGLTRKNGQPVKTENGPSWSGVAGGNDLTRENGSNCYSGLIVQNGPTSLDQIGPTA